MKNDLRKLAHQKNLCKQDWANANKMKDAAKRATARGTITSVRNRVRAGLKREIKRVETYLGRTSRV